MAASTNGNVDPDLLVLVSGVLTHWATGTAFTRMSAACAAATGTALDIVNDGGGYRDIPYQQRLYDRRAAYLPIIIAPPGRSTHGWGTAVDLTIPCFTPAVRVWLGTNAAAYGFARPPADDPRHFLHDGKTLGPLPAVTPTPIEELDMLEPYIWTRENVAANGEGYAFIDSNFVDGIVVTSDRAEAAHYSRMAKALGGTGAGRELGRAEFNQIAASTVYLWRKHAYKATVTLDVNLTPAQLEQLAAEIAEVIPGASPADVVAALKPELDEIDRAIAGVPAGVRSAIIADPS